jgi:CBS-domain-containing membrane protein
MKVKNVMTDEVRTVKTTDTLSGAAMIMWDRDCGIVPVIDDGAHVIGVITDRDICMAVSMRDAAASAIPVSSTMSRVVYTVNPEDDIQDALDLMSEHQLRRLVVVDADGTLSGILSVGDIVRHSDKGKSRKHVAHKDAMKMLKAVSSPRQTVPAAGTSTPDVQAGADLHSDAVASTAGK